MGFLHRDKGDQELEDLYLLFIRRGDPEGSRPCYLCRYTDRLPGVTTTNTSVDRNYWRPIGVSNMIIYHTSVFSTTPHYETTLVLIVRTDVRPERRRRVRNLKGQVTNTFRITLDT